MSTFAVGEVAILIQHNEPVREVTIDGIDPVPWVCRDGMVHGCYHLSGWPATDYVCGCALRKRRPPQDWTRLCRLDAAPVEAKAREVA